MSDLSGLSSIGGTLSALQDTGLREFIETNSGSWTGGETPDLSNYVPYSADNLQFGDNTAQTRCFALGSNVSASDNSFALGQNNSARYYSIALGGTNIANNLSLSIGGDNNAQNNSLAQGNHNSATTASEAVGYYNTANDNSLTVGQYNSAGSYSIAVGYQSRAYWNSIALSNGSANTGSLAIGGNAHTGSIAIGSNANSATNYSQALGYNVSATDNCMAIGKLNATTNAAFVIGNGYTANTGGYYPEYHYSDAFIIDHSGNVSAAGKISANGVELGAGGTEYSAGANIDITDNVISGKDWTSEIAAVTSLIPNSIPVKLLTNSVNTSEVTYGDLRALCNGTKVFYVKVPGTPNYGFKIYHPTRCSDWGSHCEVCFTSEPYSPRVEEGDDMNVHNYYEANISFFFMDAKDDGPADTDIAIIGNGYDWEVNLGKLTQASINPDWNITDTCNPRYIKNKPDLSTYATKTELSSVSGSLTGYQEVGDYYSATNPSGFITGVDLTPYQTTAGMTAYIPATVVATSADATGSNILYVVTGE